MTVSDTTAPAFDPLAEIIAEATGPLTQVILEASLVSDALGVVSLVNDAPPAGFPLGSTDVTWTATDGRRQ